MLKSEYHESFVLDDVEWFVDAMIKLESKRSFYLNSEGAIQPLVMSKRAQKTF